MGNFASYISANTFDFAEDKIGVFILISIINLDYIAIISIDKKSNKNLI